MQRIPPDLYQKLEFDKVLHLLEGHCQGQPARARAGALPLLTERSAIERELRLVEECKQGIEGYDPLPIGAYEDLSEALKHLQVEGYVLSVDELMAVRGVLRLFQELAAYFEKERREKYPHLFSLLGPFPFDSTPLAALDAVFDEKGELRPDASPALKKIRRAIVGKQVQIDQEFRRIIQTYRQKGWLSDMVESYRNGRRVLSVPAEYKRQIRGIIHDESATGKTVFIEPEAIIELNNELFDLHMEERSEIQRILRELCARLRPFAPMMAGAQEVVIAYDLIHARARLAVDLQAVRPTLKDRPHLGIRQGRHPLLYLKNRKQERETVPFDLVLHGKNRIVVLSGPNAGGKTILMKSVGLLQLMLQSGMLVPAAENSEMGVFHRLFADIGDQQSLEDDLSTYSSRLENMRRFLENADAHTLVLIDEFGSGTDPKIGGAIAEAILRELNRRKVFGVLTTHYSNLKLFAFKTPGIVNGSMLFDKENLRPTYQFRVGRPGSSFAFEIAAKSGLSPAVLRYARKRTGRNEKAVDELLIDLQREKQEVEEKLAALKEREQMLEKLIRNYEALHRDLEYRRKKHKLETRQQDLQRSAREQRELERLIRELREAQNLEKAKELAAQVRAEKAEAEKEVQSLEQEVYRPLEKALEKRPIRAGDFVRLRNGGTGGRVETVHKNKAVVQVGDLRMTLPLRDLEPAPEPLDRREALGIRTDTVAGKAGFDSRLDIRGMRLEEALQVLQDFLDRALIAGADSLRIIHGKGNGVLRQAVRQKLKEYPAVKSARHPEPEFGGDGVTIVDL